VSARLYFLSLSHPSQAARLMLERKGIEHEIVELVPAIHPIQLRLAGFSGTTVPALRLDGRRIQGSREISRELERERPEPPLFPPEPERRRAVEEAEEWGDRAFQPIPRRLFRWALSTRDDLRAWMASEVMRMPAPHLIATINAPIVRVLARKSHADEQHVRADVEALPSMLDHVDDLIASGVIGGEQPNAADFQIGTTVWALMALSDIKPLVAGSPAAELAARLMPPMELEVPTFLPPSWFARVPA